MTQLQHMEKNEAFIEKVRLEKRYFGMRRTLCGINELLRKLIYNDLGDWIEVNKAIKNKTHNYLIMPMYEHDIDEEFDAANVDYYIIVKRKVGGSE